MPKSTKRRQSEGCDFLDDYDDESTKSVRQVNTDEQNVCSSFHDAVKRRSMMLGFGSRRSER